MLAILRLTKPLFPVVVGNFSYELLEFRCFLEVFIVAQLQIMTLSFVMPSVRLSAWDNSATTGLIFMKFYGGEFC